MQDEVNATTRQDADEADETANPAGEVRLPKYRGHAARAMALAGIALGLSTILEAGTTHMGTTTGP